MKARVLCANIPIVYAQSATPSFLSHLQVCVCCCCMALQGAGDYCTWARVVTCVMLLLVLPATCLLIPQSVGCRLGVESAALHDIYSPAVTQALKSALLQFDKKLPGFISDAGLLHGVETRTSSPVSGCSLGVHCHACLCKKLP